MKFNLNQSRFAFRHLKKTNATSLIFLGILTIILLQQQKRSNYTKKIFEINTKKYLTESRHNDTLIKGVAEQ
ncbi:hypothetical protein AYK25_06270 [Thermoplasmatales archaeon SM1-50]|nr:MAG: hypothetical protein AYK25_06270 [Thermoplasmatales archaeon SM1-50]